MFLIAFQCVHLEKEFQSSIEDSIKILDEESM